MTREEFDELLGYERQYVRDQLNSAERTLAWIDAHAEIMFTLGLRPNVFVGWMALRGPTGEPLTRAQMLAVVQALPGKWDKHDTGGGSFRYARRCNDGEVRVEFQCGELPPSCHVVEETRTVPAHIEKVKRIVCAHAQEESDADGNNV